VRSEAPEQVVAPNGVIADRYRLLFPLGSGASGSVWAAADETLGRHVALKLLFAASAADEVESEQLRREARALAALDHPRIITVFDYLETPGAHDAVQPVLITELLEGMSLAAHLVKGPLPWPEALAVCGQLADALTAAHRAGIVHRDVKPANVMLTATGTKLLDFGIAQGPTERGPTGGLAVGTPMCMAPEQLTGLGAQPASDVYALGCVLHWCLTGRPPYPETDMAWLGHAHLHATPPALEIPGLPPGIDELYLTCLAKDPSGRPTANQVLQRLAPHAHNSPDDRPETSDTTQLLPIVGNTDPDPNAGLPSTPARHAGGPARIDRRKLLPAALLLAALAVLTILLLSLAHTMRGRTAVAPSAKAAVTPTTATTTSPAPGTPTIASVILPSASAADTPSQSPTPAASALPALPDPATDPLGYVQGISNQIQALIAQGPSTLQSGAGQDLRISVANLQNTLASAQQNNGKKLWRTVDTKISAIEQNISSDAAAGQISQPAATLLTGELQRLANQLPTNNG
jgi:serine/threonine protein kinase